MERREWDERYADLALGKRNWQIAAAGSLAVALDPRRRQRLAERPQPLHSVRRRSRSRKLGYALTIPQPLTVSAVPDVVARIQGYEIAAFIRNARAVSSDPQVEQQQLNALLAHARGAADRFLDEYYHSDGFSHNPFKRAEKTNCRGTDRFDSSPLGPQLSGALDRDYPRSERRQSRRADALGSTATEPTHSAEFQRHDRD
ncbi:MAG TPA: hypothetical protein VKS22_06940 [Candidatus Binataceae bacterium]|nr:hypothetical protein [Candidatus Binataceae bacterium]